MSCKLVLENKGDSAVYSSLEIKPISNINNLKNPFKSSAAVFDSQNGEVSIQVTFASPTDVGCVLFPCCTLLPSAKVQVLDIQGYPDGDEKYILAGTVLANWDFSQNLNDSLNTVNTALLRNTPPVGAYYFKNNIKTTGFTIKISEIEQQEIAISRLVIAPVVNFRINADYSSAVTWEDSSQHTRASSSDVRTSSGVISKSMDIDMQWIIPADRDKVQRLFLQGVGKYVFISLLPDHEDPSLERQFSIYGKLNNLGSFGLTEYGVQGTNYKIIGY